MSFNDGRRAEDAASVPAPANDSLDPDDWEAFRGIAHAFLDQAIDGLKTVRDQPVWRPVPDAVRAALQAPLPFEPAGTARTCEEALKLITPYATGNIHPRFFGWVHGTGTAGGILAGILTAAMNSNAGGRDHGAVYVERQVVAWCRELFGFPQSTSGILLSGTSMATALGLAVARHQIPEADLRGLGSSTQPLLAVYASSEAHISVAKGVELLGLGRQALRQVPVDAEYRMDLPALRAMVADDRRRGIRPMCVVATAGTVNTGAFDPLQALATFCADEALWLHVDGAFGAWVRLAASLSDNVRGIDRADSLAFDFHKWLHVPYDAGCLLVRHGDKHLQTFQHHPDYLARTPRGLAGGQPWYCDLGPELSRGARAIKVWFTLREHGLRRLGEKIVENCAQARHLADLVNSHPELTLASPVSCNIVCWRFLAPHLTPAEEDQLQLDIVADLQEAGIAAPSTTRIGGRAVIRVAITNHRTRTSDIDQLMDDVLARGRKRTAPSHLSRWPEFATLAADVRISVDARQELPFIVRAHDVSLSPRVLMDDGIALRWALELSAWQRAAPQLGDSEESSGWSLFAALALLAGRTTALYAATLPGSEGHASALAPWMKSALDVLGAAPSELPLAVDSLIESAGLLLELQGLPAPVSSTERGLLWPLVVEKFLRAMPAASPLETLLTSGGDSRLSIDACTGLSRYGCRPGPRPWTIALASTTASSISCDAHAQIEATRRDLMGSALQGNLGETLARATEQVGQDILRACEAMPGTEILLTASGTEAELGALFLALSASSAPVRSIVVGPAEIGTHSGVAAAGQHFDDSSPLGTPVEKGALIDPYFAGRVEVATIDLRRDDGCLRAIEDVDRDVEDAVENAIAAGQRVLLHVLDVSKTGLIAPSLKTVVRLKQRHPTLVDVVVDACQLRLAPVTLRAYGEAGFLLMISGSKFLTGPPFAGALLVPESIGTRVAESMHVPAGLRAYACKEQWPRAWRKNQEALPAASNAGLLLRWQAALWEARRFSQVPSDEVHSTLSRLSREIAHAIAARPYLRLLETRTLDRGPFHTANAWDAIRTIFTFTVSAASRRLGESELARIHAWMNQDISVLLPELDGTAAKLAATCCHTGRPVAVARTVQGEVAGLRVSVSARMVSRIAFDSPLGASTSERMNRVLDDVRRAFAKLDLVVSHQARLQASTAVAERDGRSQSHRLEK